MADIIINSHDLLGKLAVIKNSLAMILESGKVESKETIKYVDMAFKTNQDLIEFIKKLSAHAQNSHH